MWWFCLLRYCQGQSCGNVQWVAPTKRQLMAFMVIWGLNAKSSGLRSPGNIPCDWGGVEGEWLFVQPPLSGGSMIVDQGVTNSSIRDWKWSCGLLTSPLSAHHFLGSSKLIIQIKGNDWRCGDDWDWISLKSKGFYGDIFASQRILMNKESEPLVLQMNQLERSSPVGIYGTLALGLGLGISWWIKPWPFFMVFTYSLWSRLDGHTIGDFTITWSKLRKREALTWGRLILG